MTNHTQHLSALWVGGALSYIERLCLTSMLDTGHLVALYTYGGVPNAPAGIDLRDASEIMPQNMMVQVKKQKSFALGSDLFRYRLLQKGLGTCWVDCDMLFLQPLRAVEHIFGYERPDAIATGVLRLPADSPILAGVLRMAHSSPIIPPWWPVGKKAEQWVRWLRGRSRGIERMDWGTVGPRAVTYFAGKHGLQIHSKQIAAFYPNPWENAFDVFDPAVDVRVHFTPETIGVHLWNTEIKKYKLFDPPSGSFLDAQCRRLGISNDREKVARPFLMTRAGGALQ